MVIVIVVVDTICVRGLTSLFSGLQIFKNVEIYLQTAIQKESLPLLLKIYFTPKLDKNYISDLNSTKIKENHSHLSCVCFQENCWLLNNP